MPEETAQVQTPENKSSVLDKNVPNPLAKNPNVHTHKVFASVGLILIGVVVILSILAYFYRDQVADLFDTKQAEETTTTKVSTSSATTETQTTTETKTDETADWKTYTNTKYSYSLKYPSDSQVISGVEDLGDNEELRKLETTAVINVIKPTPEADLQTFLQVIAQNNTKSLSQIKQELMAESVVSNLEDTTVDGVAALKYSDTGFNYVTTVKNNVKYDFGIIHSDTGNKVLLTFKFI